MTKRQKLCKQIAQNRNFCKINAIIDFARLMGCDNEYKLTVHTVEKTWVQAFKIYK